MPLSPTLLLLLLCCTPDPGQGPDTGGGGSDDGGMDDGGSPEDGGVETDGGTTGDGGGEEQPALILTLPEAAHELSPLVCTASEEASLSWSLDGEPWTGETETTTLHGDTIPARTLRADQRWSCAAEGAEPVETTVAPYSHPVLVEPVDAGPGDDVVIHYRGELLEEGPVTLDLGYDGWTDQGEATPDTRRTDRGGTEYLHRLELDEDGQVALTLPEGIAALHLAFWTEDSPADEDEAVLWGLELPASGPWLTVDPDGTLAVHFLSTARGPATVDLSWEGGSLQLADDSTDELHHLRLDGVPASVDLDYRITEASGRSSDTWTTHRVDPEAAELTVIAAADMQDTGSSDQRWPEVAVAMAELVTDADLLVIPGDLASDDRPSLWWLYFHGGGSLFAEVPQVMAVGNHDTPTPTYSADTTSVLRYFDPQGDGPGAEIGTLAYGPLELLLLNSEVPEEWEPGGVQALWAEEALLEPKRAAFTWVAFHRPAYDVAERFADEQYLFRTLTQAFDGRVDMVLTGHEHLYQRFEPLRYEAQAAPSGDYGLGEDDGPAYLVLPAAGNRGYFEDLAGPDDPGGELRDLVAYPELEPDQVLTEPFHGFVEVRIEDSRMEAQTWRITDHSRTVEDAFFVER